MRYQCMDFGVYIDSVFMEKLENSKDVNLILSKKFTDSAILERPPTGLFQYSLTFLYFQSLVISKDHSNFKYSCLSSS